MGLEGVGTQRVQLECSRYDSKFGALHPLLKVRKQVKDILIQLGREEMATNNYVDSSFWKFDALFQPQQHAARHSHDTFFLKTPSTTRKLPEDNVECMSVVVLSPGDMVVIGKALLPKSTSLLIVCSRNESVDRTHLAEFHQIEGCICDRGLTLGDLIGVPEDFFSRLGMSELKFKPAYNPYTEPSMEIFGYHKGFGKWAEIGKSGMFRPEMLNPMGVVPEDVEVIA